MKKALAINVSPRKEGTSAMLVNILKSELEDLGNKVNIAHLYSHIKNFETVFDMINDADTIIVCGPCYVNTYPADTTRFLEEMATKRDIFHGQNLYGIIQGGMPYAHTHISGLNMLKIFAAKVGMQYKGGFVMGLGAMLEGQPISKLPNGKKVMRQLNVFYRNIHNGKESPDCLYEAALLKMPGIITRVLVAVMNRRIDKIFSAKGMDAHQPSPYFLDDCI